MEGDKTIIACNKLCSVALPFPPQVEGRGVSNTHTRLLHGVIITCPEYIYIYTHIYIYIIGLRIKRPHR